MSKFKRCAQGRQRQQRSPLRIFRRKSVICKTEMITTINYWEVFLVNFPEKGSAFTKKIKCGCQVEKTKNTENSRTARQQQQTTNQPTNKSPTEKRKRNLPHTHTQTQKRCFYLYCEVPFNASMGIVFSPILVQYSETT